MQVGGHPSIGPTLAVGNEEHQQARGGFTKDMGYMGGGRNGHGAGSGEDHSIDRAGSGCGYEAVTANTVGKRRDMYHQGESINEDTHPKFKSLMGAQIMHVGGVYLMEILKSVGKTHLNLSFIVKYQNNRGMLDLCYRKLLGRCPVPTSGPHKCRFIHASKENLLCPFVNNVCSIIEPGMR